jgi:hypothetical protein
VGLVWSGTSKVRTKGSGALLSAHLACALLAHFASQGRTSSILQLAPFPSVQVGRNTQHLRPTPLVRFVFCIGIILVFAVELFIASYRWPQTSQPSFCHDCAIYCLAPAFCCRCHRCCSLRSCCHHHCPQQSPTTDHHPPPCLLPLSWCGSAVIERGYKSLQAIICRFICALCLCPWITKLKKIYPAMHPVERPGCALQRSGAACAQPH